MDIIKASDPIALRKILHVVAQHQKLSKQLTVVDEPEAANTRNTPKSNRSDCPPPPLNLSIDNGKPDANTAKAASEVV